MTLPLKRLLQITFCATVLFCGAVSFVHAQTGEPDMETVTFVKAKTISTAGQQVKQIPGTNTTSEYQNNYGPVA